MQRLRGPAGRPVRGADRTVVTSASGTRRPAARGDRSQPIDGTTPSPAPAGSSIWPGCPRLGRRPEAGRKVKLVTLLPRPGCTHRLPGQHAVCPQRPGIEGPADGLDNSKPLPAPTAGAHHDLAWNCRLRSSTRSPYTATSPSRRRGNRAGRPSASRRHCSVIDAEDQARLTRTLSIGRRHLGGL